MQHLSLILLVLAVLVYGYVDIAQGDTGNEKQATKGPPAGSDIKKNTADGDWELVHEVEILLPQDKKVFGKVEVMLDRHSVKIQGHEVYYRARIFRKSQTSESETIEQRISDCQAGRYKIQKVTNLRTGKETDLREQKWRKPRQVHVLKLETYVCEKVCGMDYPDQKPKTGSCLAR